MGIDLSSTVWTGAEQLKWRETVMAPMAGVSLGFCVLALTIYYIFPGLKAFPRCILSWFMYYNTLYVCYIIWKWSPYSALHPTWGVKNVPGSTPCALSTFLDTVTATGSTFCNMLVTLTVLLVVVFKFNIEAHKTWLHRSYWVFAVVFPFILSVIVTVLFSRTTEQIEGRSCVISNTKGQLVSRIPSYALLGLQFVCIVVTLFYTKRIMSSVRSTTGNNFPMAYLVVRFMATFFTQLLSVFPAQLNNSLPSSFKNAIWSRFYLSVHVFGPTIDSIILILANVMFMAWAKKQVAQCRGRNDNPKERLPTTGSGTGTVTVELKEIPSNRREENDVQVGFSEIEITMDEEEVETNTHNSSATHLVSGSARSKSVVDKPDVFEVLQGETVNPEGAASIGQGTVLGEGDYSDM